MPETQTSKDGKIKSKNFNLFAQFSGSAKPVEKAASSPGSASEDDAVDEDGVSEKL